MQTLMVMATLSLVMVVIITFGRDLLNWVLGIVSPSPTNPSAAQSPTETHWFFDPKILLFVVGGIIALLAWSTKRLFDFVNLRARLAVLDVMSDGKDRTLNAVISDVKRRKSLRALRILRFRGAVTDALAALVAEDKIRIDNHRYIRCSEKTSPEP